MHQKRFDVRKKQAVMNSQRQVPPPVRAIFDKLRTSNGERRQKRERNPDLEGCACSH